MSLEFNSVRKSCEDLLQDCISSCICIVQTLIVNHCTFIGDTMPIFHLLHVSAHSRPSCTFLFIEILYALIMALNGSKRVGDDIYGIFSQIKLNLLVYCECLVRRYN
jgi:hypothetical protein